MTNLRVILAVLLAGWVIAGDLALAQEAPPPFPEFTFRRVTVPGADHQGPRITIQIGDRPAQAPVPQAAAAPSSTSGEDWFWAAIPAGRDFSAGRYLAVMDLLAIAPEAAELPVMRAEGLLSLAQAHGARLLSESIGTQVSPALALAVMAVESRGDDGAESAAGAQGLMQLIPATAARFGVEDPFDADQNIAGGIAYLDWLMEEFDRDPILVLAAYNAGEGAVRGANGVPDYAETRAYVPRVMATWAAARLLCVSPPELVSDGCVFRPMVASGG